MAKGSRTCVVNGEMRSVFGILVVPGSTCHEVERGAC